MASALQSYNTGHFAEAEQICRQLLTQVPRHPAVHQLLAILALDGQRLEAARQHIIQSLDERPRHGPTLLIAGKIARAEGDLATAAGYFETASAAMPGAEAHFHLANILSAQGRTEEAITVFRRAAALAPNAMEIVLNLGTALRDNGELQAARDAFEKAVALQPSFAEAWFNLGLTRQDLHDGQGAVDAFAEALRLRPDYADAALNLGIALQETRRMEEALVAYRMAAGLQPALFGRIAHAMAAGSTGQLWLSSAHLRRALRL